jgi:hypothetical protein
VKEADRLKCRANRLGLGSITPNANATMNIMRNVRAFFVALLVTGSLATPVRAAAMWGIYWLSNPIPCGQALGAGAGLAGPIISSYYKSCEVNGTKVSICPGTLGDTSPWDTGKSITVVGYELTCMVSSPSAQCTAEVGSADGKSDGADVFATTAGVGTNSKAAFFPAGVGIPQGDAPRYAHFDVYAACDGGPNTTMQMLVNIYYTSPVGRAGGGESRLHSRATGER